MKFIVSRMYCKYVINVINDEIIKIRQKNLYNDELEDKLYFCYLKLERILNQENT